MYGAQLDPIDETLGVCEIGFAENYSGLERKKNSNEHIS